VVVKESMDGILEDRFFVLVGLGGVRMTGTEAFFGSPLK
jgi:hypothetical protein